MSTERLTYTPQNGGYTSKVRVAELAARQYGSVTWAQLRAAGVAEGTVKRWKAVGYLMPVPLLPGVYSVGPRTDDEPTRLFSLILFAGPGAALSHGTAAHWRGWLRYPVKATHISTPRRIRTHVRSTIFHGVRGVDHELINGIPCTTTIQTLLDLAATEPPKLVNRALAQLDYERRLDAKAIRAACGRGRPGSAKLLDALDSYMPQLALTKSELEDEFLHLCRRYDIPLPEVNASLHGEEPDCYWPEYGLVVELDGDGTRGNNHGSPAQRRRDRRKELTLRAHGLSVVRYGGDQVAHDAVGVAADVLAQIDQRRRASHIS